MPSWYPTKENPISGCFFKEQAELISEKNDVIVLHYNIHYVGFLNFILKTLCKKFILIKKGDDLRLRDVSLDLYLLKFNKYFNLIIRFLGLKKIKEKFISSISKRIKKQAFSYLLNFIPKPDLLYGVTAQIIAEKAEEIADFYKIPYVLSEHSPFPVPGTILSESTKTAIEHSDAFISISNDKTRQILMQNINIHPYLVGNMIDEDKFQPVHRSGNAHVFTILIVAAYNFYKDYETFLSAMKLLKKIVSIPFEVNIVGYCPVKDINMWNLGEAAFIDLVNEYGVMDICHLIPKVDRKDICNYYNDADVFVMTSIQEGFPVSSLEATACGLPVFATRCGGVEDFIDDKCGRLFNLQDYKSIAYALKDLIEGRISFDSEYIRNKVISNYGKQAFLDKMNKVFEKTIENYKDKEN